MEPQTLQRCQEIIDYKFDDPSLLAMALTHASVASTRAESNERLEFLGDSVLGLTVCHELYASRGDLLEGDMTKIKSAVVSGATCAAIAAEIGLCDVLSTGKGMGEGVSMPLSVAGALFEAIIGAIFLDGGMTAARDFILRHVRPHIEEALRNEHQCNYKSLLQQYAQRDDGPMPQYLLLDEKGPDHSKCFEIAIKVNGTQFPSAWGMSKKDAEQAAARKALVAMGVIEDDEADD